MPLNVSVNWPTSSFASFWGAKGVVAARGDASRGVRERLDRSADDALESRGDDRRDEERKRQHRHEDGRVKELEFARLRPVIRHEINRPEPLRAVHDRVRIDEFAPVVVIAIAGKIAGLRHPRSAAILGDDRSILHADERADDVRL